MPIKLPIGLRRLKYEEFAQAAYQVMEVAFAVHRQLGRLFDEAIYHREVARRLKGAQAEVPIEVCFGTFRKIYYLDLVWAEGAVFEFKAVLRLIERHRAQLLHYLLLADLPHGKLVNMRPESIEHEFVNSALRREDRICFAAEDRDYAPKSQSGVCLRELIIPMLRDWGVGLDIELYEEALTHFLGGEEKVLQPVGIYVGGNLVANQALRLLEPGIAFKVSALGKGKEKYELQLRRFLAHADLEAIQWINVGREVVSFTTLKK